MTGPPPVPTQCAATTAGGACGVIGCTIPAHQSPDFVPVVSRACPDCRFGPVVVVPCERHTTNSVEREFARSLEMPSQAMRDWLDSVAGLAESDLPCNVSTVAYAIRVAGAYRNDAWAWRSMFEDMANRREHEHRYPAPNTAGFPVGQCLDCGTWRDSTDG